METDIVITKVENARWHDAEHFSITCDVTVQGLGKMPFSVGHRTDTPYGIKLWQEFQDGIHGAIAPYIAPPEPSPAEKRALMPELERWRVNTVIDLEPGLREKINAAIDTMPEPQRTISKNKLADVQFFSRVDPLFEFIGNVPDIAKSPEDIDAMWEMATTLQ